MDFFELKSSVSVEVEDLEDLVDIHFDDAVVHLYLYCKSEINISYLTNP